MNLRLYLFLTLIFVLNFSLLNSQSIPLTKNIGYWQIVVAKSLQTDAGILSTEILNEIREHNQKLKKLVGHQLYYKDSCLLFDWITQNSFNEMDTIFFSKPFKYKIVKDDRLTLKYPGDELSDTLNINRKVGITFANLIGVKNSNYLEVLIGENPKDKLSSYRLCKVTNHKIALVLLDSSILLICEYKIKK